MNCKEKPLGVQYLLDLLDLVSAINISSRDVMLQLMSPEIFPGILLHLSQ
jgi:hypothetical protein